MEPISKADIHIHTTFSDGLYEPEQVVHHAATQTDLRVIAITDHNTIAGAQAAYDYWQKHRYRFKNLELIRGIEVSSSGGHILGLFVEEDIPQNMSPAETIRAIHAQGGLAIAPHPFAHLLSFTGMRGVGKQIGELPFDGVEVRSAAPSEFYANVITAVYNHFSARHATLGSSDSHHLTTLGTAYTKFPGKTAQDFGRAVLNKQVRSGGRVNGLVDIFQTMQQMKERGLRPLFLPNDRQHRHVQFGLTLDVSAAPQPDTVVIRCFGDLVAGNADLLTSQGRSLLAAKYTSLVIDLQNVKFMDSAGIGSLVGLQKGAQQSGRVVYLSNFSGNIFRGLQLVRLDKVFPELLVSDKVLPVEFTAVNVRPSQQMIT
jgi:anti-anti-sigma factor